MDFIPPLSRIAAEALARQFGLDIGDIGADTIELLATAGYGGVRQALGQAATFWQYEEPSRHSEFGSMSNPSGENTSAVGGAKRARHEDEGMEPYGHGNAPATGTHLTGYVQKYVPTNFPDAITLKLRYCDIMGLRTIATTTANQPSVAYFLWNTNSLHTMVNSSAHSIDNYAHRPNQFTNWAAQYGYYRVCELNYKIVVANTANISFIQTANPSPGTFVNAQQAGDALVSLMPTQTATDISGPIIPADVWESKQAQNVYLPARTGGTISAIHAFHGTITPEDYDIDPIKTATDETWTATGVDPATVKLLGLFLAPAAPFSTAALLPEAGVNIFVEFFFTVQFKGYLPSLRAVGS